MLAPPAAASRTNASALARLSSSTSLQLICTTARRTPLRVTRSLSSSCGAKVPSATFNHTLRLLLCHAVESPATGDERGDGQRDQLATREQLPDHGQRFTVVDVVVLRHDDEPVADVEVGIGERQAHA